MSIYRCGLFLVMTASTISPAFSQQGDWQEFFSHNNPGLYTNMNGQPDNLTIVDGVAYFDGEGGAYYARQDLMIPLLNGATTDTSLHGYYVPGFWTGSGSVGFGWFSPSLNQGISVVCNRETGQTSTIRHDGWNTTVVLRTSNFGTLFDSLALDCFKQPGDYDAWVVHAISSLGHGGWIGNAVHSLKMQPDMFFFMYGSEGNVGPGGMDTITGSAVPEPLGIVALGLGVVALIFRIRKR